MLTKMRGRFGKLMGNIQDPKGQVEAMTFLLFVLFFLVLGLAAYYEQSPVNINHIVVPIGCSILSIGLFIMGYYAIFDHSLMRELTIFFGPGMLPAAIIRRL